MQEAVEVEVTVQLLALEVQGVVVQAQLEQQPQPLAQPTRAAVAAGQTEDSVTQAVAV
jgi:hypothetical protein